MGSNIQPLRGAPAKPAPHKRTLSLWILLMGFLALSIYGWARLGYSLQDWYWLNFSGVRPGPAYLVVTGGLWGVSGLVAAVWIYLLRNGYRIVGSGAALFMALLYWIDRIFFNSASGMGPNATFAMGMTLFLLAYTALALGLFTDQRKAAFAENKQRESDVEIRARD